MEEEDGKQDDWVDIVRLPENVSVKEFKAMVAVDAEMPVMGEFNNAELLAVGQSEINEEDEEELQPPLSSKQLMSSLADVG